MRIHNIIIHRLTPYHCELNIIELILIQVKTSVAKNSTTLKLNKIRTLLEKGINDVLSES